MRTPDHSTEGDETGRRHPGYVANTRTIYYRRLSMNRPVASLIRPALSHGDADEYASWFRCLADGTRLLVLHAVATAGRAMTVGEIVDCVGVGQSTVSHHLRILAEERFVHMRANGTRTLVTVNRNCLQEFPEAAARIMGFDPQ